MTTDYIDVKYGSLTNTTVIGRVRRVSYLKKVSHLRLNRARSTSRSAAADTHRRSARRAGKMADRGRR